MTCLIFVTRSAKRLIGEKLTGGFFGYLMELAWNNDFFTPGRPARMTVSTIQRSGHLGLRKLLHSPDIDFFVSPYGYAFRGLGGDGLAMQPSEALRTHGKIYFMEEDTLMHNNFDPEGRMHVMENTVSVYQRIVRRSAHPRAGRYLVGESTTSSKSRGWSRNGAA